MNIKEAIVRGTIVYFMVIGIAHLFCVLIFSIPMYKIVVDHRILVISVNLMAYITLVLFFYLHAKFTTEIEESKERVLEHLKVEERFRGIVSVCFKDFIHEIVKSIAHKVVFENTERKEERKGYKCPYCSSTNTVLREGNLYCLECGKVRLDYVEEKD